MSCVTKFSKFQTEETGSEAREIGNSEFPGPLLQNKGRCSAFDMEIIFLSHASKTHFYKKRSAPKPHFESEGFWNSEVAYWGKLHNNAQYFTIGKGPLKRRN